MKTSKQDRCVVTLIDNLMLAKKISKLGWAYGYLSKPANQGVTYLLFNVDVSRRRRKNNIALDFDNIDLVQGLMNLIESGLKESVILGELENAPSFDDYLAMERRFRANGCKLRGEMDFDRMTVGYRISINEQSLLFNRWEAVEELESYLYIGGLRKASVGITIGEVNAPKEFKK